MLPVPGSIYANALGNGELEINDMPSNEKRMSSIFNIGS